MYFFKTYFHEFNLLTLKMTFSHQNNTINVFSSQNPIKQHVIKMSKLYSVKIIRFLLDLGIDI